MGLVAESGMAAETRPNSPEYSRLYDSSKAAGGTRAQPADSEHGLRARSEPEPVGRSDGFCHVGRLSGERCKRVERGRKGGKGLTP